MDERKIVLYIAASLDGYIATEDQNLEWLLSTEGEGDNGYSAFYDTVDTILIGRTTYDWITEHEHGNWPYKGKECYVFSHTKRENNENVTFIQDEVIPFIRNLKNQEGRRIWLVGGGILIDLLRKQKLIDEMILTMAPVLLGSGIPLFYRNEEQSRLALKQVCQYNQFAELHYDVLN